MKAAISSLVLLILAFVADNRVAAQPAIAQMTNSLGMRLQWMPAVNLWVSAWETRVVDFAAFVADTGRSPNTNMSTELPQVGGVKQGNWWLCPGFPQSLNHPVIGVTADDADAFCSWLTQKERQQSSIPATNLYRLPTGDEWAAIYRAAGVKPVPESVAPGNTDPPLANIASEELRSWHRKLVCPFLTNYFDGFDRTAPVGSFSPSAAGLFDLEGNVKEWCADTYPGNPMLRTLAGTGWTTGCDFGPKIGGVLPSQPTDVFGFRIVLSGPISSH